MSTAEQAVGVSNEPGAAKIYGVVLTVGVICALAIVSAYEVTKPIIQEKKILWRNAAILAVLPGAKDSKAFRVGDAGEVEEVSADTEGNDLVFAGYSESGALVGLAIETQGMGYQEIIRLMYGYSFQQQAVIGTSVLESRETPGLGDRIEKDVDYLANFKALDVSLNPAGTEVVHPIQFVKQGEKADAWQIDGITGATISSRAVAEMLKLSTAEWIPKVYAHQAEFATAGQEGG